MPLGSSEAQRFQHFEQALCFSGATVEERRFSAA